MSVFYIVAIKNVPESSYYVCVSDKQEANTLKYFLEEHKRDNTKYVTLSESVKKHGLKNFVCTRLRDRIFDNRESAELFVFEKLNELSAKGKMLNDKIINPTRVPCPGCDKKIRQEFLESHQTNYCVGAFSDF